MGWSSLSHAETPWTRKTYEDLRDAFAAIPEGDRRDEALERIRVLDCTSPGSALASCDPDVPPPAAAVEWRRTLEESGVSDDAYDNALAAVLKNLVCATADDAIHVLRGLVRGGSDGSGGDGGDGGDGSSGRLESAGRQAPALVDFIMSKDCPLSRSLTNGDKAELLRIRKDALEGPGP